MGKNSYYTTNYNRNYPPIISDERLALCAHKAAVLEEQYKNYVPEPVPERKTNDYPFWYDRKKSIGKLSGTYIDQSKVNALAFLRELKIKHDKEQTL